MDISNLPIWLQNLILWGSSAAGTALLTTILTWVITRLKRKSIIIEAKDEQIETLIGVIQDLKIMIMNMCEMTLISIGANRGLPQESKDKAAVIMNRIKKHFGNKLDQTVFELIEATKAANIKEKDEAIQKAKEIRAATQKGLNDLGASLDELTKKEITKD